MSRSWCSKDFLRRCGKYALLTVVGMVVVPIVLALAALVAAVLVVGFLVGVVYGLFKAFFLGPLLGAGIFCWPVQWAWNNSIPFLPDLTLLNAFALVFLILLLRQPRADFTNHGKTSSTPPSFGNLGIAFPKSIPGIPGLRKRSHAASKAKRP